VTKPKSGRYHWIKWDLRAWRSDAKLRACSIGARGLLIQLVALMHECDPYGHLVIGGRPPEDVAIGRLVGEPNMRRLRRWLAELETAGFIAHTAAGFLFSPRMFKDDAARREALAAVGSTDLVFVAGSNCTGARGREVRTRRLRDARSRGRHTPAEWRTLLRAVRSTCPRCQREVDRLEKDHVVPLAMPESSDAASNIQPLCQPCNVGKKRETTDWLAVRGLR
jgi:hypothetical protein